MEISSVISVKSMENHKDAGNQQVGLPCGEGDPWAAPSDQRGTAKPGLMGAQARFGQLAFDPVGPWTLICSPILAKPQCRSARSVTVTVPGHVSLGLVRAFSNPQIGALEV